MLITDRETNKVYFSQLIKNFTCYNSIIEKLDKYNIVHDTLSFTKDYWVRDFMPIQITEKNFIQYKYQPDYLKNNQKYISNPKECCKYLKIKSNYIDIILDGGNIIKCFNKIIMTDKVFVENTNHSKLELTNQLENTFNCEIIIIPWDKTDIYGHADGMVRYITDNTILLNNYNNYNKTLRNRILKILEKHFNIKELSYNTSKPSIYNWIYINYLQVSNLILLPMLGIDEDQQALEQFSIIFPTLQIEQINVSEIAPLGGALNCISWNIKH